MSLNCPTEAAVTDISARVVDIRRRAITESKRAAETVGFRDGPVRRNDARRRFSGSER